MIVGAVIVNDFKEYALLDCLKALSHQVDRLYLNIQTENPEIYIGAFHFLQQFHSDWDIWSVSKSTWRPERQGDQDNTARLPPILTARNMAIDYAIYHGADHLLFVDSDVIVPVHTVSRFNTIPEPLVGGVVPGRGAHVHVSYIFGPQIPMGTHLIRCDHGTCGLVRIHKSIFTQVRFRQGPHPHNRGTWLAEDPCYAADAKALGLASGWFICTDVVAEHRDHPSRPLRLEEAVNDYITTGG